MSYLCHHLQSLGNIIENSVKRFHELEIGERNYHEIQSSGYCMAIAVTSTWSICGYLHKYIFLHTKIRTQNGAYLGRMEPTGVRLMGGGEYGHNIVYICMKPSKVKLQVIVVSTHL